MCLAIPYKIKSIQQGTATVSCPSCQDKTIGIQLVNNLKPGDYVLVQNNLAVSRVPAAEAQEIYKLLIK